VYNYPNPPTVTSVSGCQSSSSLSLSGCASGSVLTLTGVNLYNTSASGPWGTFIIPVLPSTSNQGPQGPPAWQCTVTTNTATQLVCSLPQFDQQVSPVQPGVTYPLLVNAWGYGGQYISSNAVRINFTPQGSSSSGLSKSGIVAIAVLVPIFALVLACALWYCLVKGGKMPSMPTLKKSTTGFGQHVDETSDSEVEIH